MINCFTAGWGRTNGEKRLKEAKVKMVSPKICLKYFSKNFQPKKQICGISQNKQRRRKGEKLFFHGHYLAISPKVDGPF